MAKKKAITTGYKMVKKKSFQSNSNTSKGDAASASSGQKRKFSDKNKKKTYMGRCKKLLSNMMELDDSKPFRTAVDKLKYPDYHSEVRYDIDLARIATKLSIGQYADPLDFGRDVRLMVNNWKVYIKDHSLPIYSQITRLSWWFESEFSKIVIAFEDHKNKRRRVEETATRPAGPPSTVQSSAIPTPPHLMSTVAENGILRIRRAPGTATTQAEGRNTSQATANINDLRNQIRNNQRPNINSSPRPSTSTQGNTNANHSFTSPGAPAAGAGSRADRQSSIAAVINATRVAVSSQARTASNVTNNSNQARVSAQHNTSTVTTASSSVASRPATASIASRLGPAPGSSRPPSSSVTSRLGPAPASARLATTPAIGRLGGLIASRPSPVSVHLPTTTTASPSSPRVNTTVPGNNTSGNNATRPVRTTTASPRISPAPPQSSGASTPSGGAAVSTPAAAPEQQEPELELLFGASHVWFGECKSKPPRDIRITEQGIEFPIKSTNYEAVISVNSNDIVRCCGHFGNLGKLQNTLFLFLTPSATKHVRSCLTENGMTGDVVSLIVIFSQNMTTEKISRLIHIFWRIGRQSIFGPLFSEVDKKGALNIIANIKPQILQRLSQNASSSSPASSDAKSPVVRSPTVQQTARSVVPNLAAAQIRRNSSSESANPSSTTPDRSQSDRDAASGIQNANDAANAGAFESQPKDSNSTASHGYTFQRSRLPRNDNRNRESQNMGVPQDRRAAMEMYGQRPNGPPFPLFRPANRPRFHNRNPNDNFVEPQLMNRLNEATRNYDYPMCNSAFHESNRSFNMQQGHPNISRRYPGLPGSDHTRERYARLLDQSTHMATRNWGPDEGYDQNSDMIPDQPVGYQSHNMSQTGQMENEVYGHNSDMAQDQPVEYQATHSTHNSDTIQDQSLSLSSTGNQVAHNDSGDSTSMEVDDPVLRAVHLLDVTESDQRRICIRISHEPPDENQNQALNGLEMSPAAEATPPVEDAATCSDENYNNTVLDSNVSSTVQTCNTDTEVDMSEMPPSEEEGRADMDTELVSSSAPTPVADVDTAVPLDSEGHAADQQQNPALDLRPESEQVDEAHEISDDDDDDLEIIIPSDIDDDLAFVPASVRQTKDEDGEDLVMMASRISTKCPVTQQVMRRPVKNRHCGHCYDRDGIQQLIINRTTKARCPVPGCTNPNVLMMSDMEFDKKLFDYIHTHNPDPELQRELDKVAEELDNQPLGTRRQRPVIPLMSLDIYTAQEINGADSD